MSLELKGILKQYGSKTVLQDLNLTLEEGKIYGLVGRNGAGKTTLLSLASAQNPVTSGEITVDGEAVWENEKALAQICFSREIIPVAGQSVNNLKAKEYLKMAEILYPHWDKKLAERLISEFELDVKQNFLKMSKGMLSMVTIIVAMASKAKYTFLDEPVAGLDVVARETFYKLLLEEYSESGRTFVVSTHIIEEAADVFEEVIFLKDGRVALLENTDDLLGRCVYVSGRSEDVDAVTKGKQIYHAEHSGRGKSLTVLLEAGEELDTLDRDVDVRGMRLQDIFVALCGREESL